MAKFNGADSNETGQASPAGTKAAQIRWGTAEFLPSFATLRDVVAAACAREDEWQAKIAAGISAALEFASRDAAAARALTLNARRQQAQRGDRAQEVIAYFTDCLAELAPSNSRWPISTDAGVIESIAIAVRGHLLAGTVAELPALAPDLTYLALMPYTGAAEAQRWAEIVSLGKGQLRYRPVR